jgi:hypothetical protein
MAQTGFEGLANAIQSAFDTYWRRRQWREQREEAGKEREFRLDVLGTDLEARAGESEKDRQNRLRVQREADIAAGERTAAQVQGRLDVEQLGIDADKYAAKQMDIFTKEQTASEERHRGYLQSMIEGESGKLTELLKNEKTTYNKFIDALAKAGWAFKPQKHEFDKMKDDIALRQNYIRSRVSKEVGEMYLRGAYYQQLGKEPALITGNALATFLSQWNLDYDFGEAPKTPTLKEQAGTTLGYESPVGGFFPTPFGLMPGKRYVEEGLEKLLEGYKEYIAPRMPKFLKREDKEKYYEEEED